MCRVNLAAMDTSSIRFQRAWFRNAVTVKGPGFQLKGKPIAPQNLLWSFDPPPPEPGKLMPYRRYHIDLGLQSEHGEFLFISQIENDSSPVGYHVRRGEVLTSEVWRAAVKYPHWMNLYQIYADHDLLVLPTPETLNATLDQIPVYHSHAVGPRFQVFPKSFEPNASEFFESLRKGFVLIPQRGLEAGDALNGNGFLGSLMIRPELFARLVHQAERVFFLSHVNLIAKHFKAETDDALASFLPFYQDISGGLAFHFPTKIASYDQMWKEGARHRALLFKILAGRARTREHADDYGVKWREDSVTLWDHARRIDLVERIRDAMRKSVDLDVETLESIDGVFRGVERTFPTPQPNVTGEEARMLERLGRAEPDVRNLNLLPNPRRS